MRTRLGIRYCYCVLCSCYIHVIHVLTLCGQTKNFDSYNYSIDPNLDCLVPTTLCLPLLVLALGLLSACRDTGSWARILDLLAA